MFASVLLPLASIFAHGTFGSLARPQAAEIIRSDVRAAIEICPVASPPFERLRAAISSEQPTRAFLCLVNRKAARAFWHR